MKVGSDTLQNSSLTDHRRRYLESLESEAIYVFREVVSQFRRPVMLYSIGKDSSVLLHLARKAFHPGRVPFPLLHIDTTWKFKEMISFRDRICAELDIELIVHTNAKGVEAQINPFDHGSHTYTRYDLCMIGTSSACGERRAPQRATARMCVCPCTRMRSIQVK